MSQNPENVENKLLQLIITCIAQGKSFIFEYDTGKFIEEADNIGPDGGFVPPGKLPPEKIKQGAKGFRIEVGRMTFENTQTGDEILYPSLADATDAGFLLLAELNKTENK